MRVGVGESVGCWVGCAVAALVTVLPPLVPQARSSVATSTQVNRRSTFGIRGRTVEKEKNVRVRLSNCTGLSIPALSIQCGGIETHSLPLNTTGKGETKARESPRNVLPKLWV